MVNTGLVERVIPQLVSVDDNLALTVLPSEEEIFKTICSMDSFSSPGLDGFGGCFFVNCWSIVGPEVVSAVRSFFLAWFGPSSFQFQHDCAYS